MKNLNLILALALICNLLVVSFFLTPLPVYADTTTLTVAGEGSLTGGSYSGGNGNYTNLNSDDGDTSYWQCTSGGSDVFRTWKCSNLTVDGIINSVTVYSKSSGSGGYNDGIYIMCRINGTNYGTSSGDSMSTSYAPYHKSWTTNPATGTAWTVSDINNAEWGEYYLASSGHIIKTTYFYVVVDYTIPPVPTITTSAVTGNGYVDPNFFATLNGNITNTGGQNADYRGFVWSTSTHSTPGNVAPASSGYSNNWTESGSFGTGTFSHQETSFSKNTTYYVRACAHNSGGWGYGSEVNFTTLSDPAISTVAASQVAATTARLNGSVTFDGGEACTVKFVYKAGTGYADYAAILADDGIEVSAAGTYTTGGSSYYNVTGLSTSTTYSFAAKITNSVSSAYGSVLTFTTKSGISEPASLTALPTSTTISLIWTKGSGSTYSLLRYSPAEYPATTTSGSMGYLGTGNSVKVTGLTPGTTYYWSAWGMSGGTYSDNYTTTLCTTLAYDDAAGSDVDIEVPAENSLWMQTPDTSKLDNVPLFNAAVNLWNENYGIPDTSIWYFIWFMVGIGGGILIYTRSSQNLIATFGAELIWFGIGSVMGLIWMWIVFVFIIIALGFIAFGHRH